MKRNDGALKELMNAWLFGMAHAGKLMGNMNTFLRMAQTKGIKTFFEKMGIKFQSTEDATEACVSYVESMNNLGIMDKEDFSISNGQNSTLEVTVGKACPYRDACRWMVESGMQPQCYQAIPLAVAIEMMRRETYVHKLLKFGDRCDLLLTPVPRLERKGE